LEIASTAGLRIHEVAALGRNLAPATLCVRAVDATKCIGSLCPRVVIVTGPASAYDRLPVPCLVPPLSRVVLYTPLIPCPEGEKWLRLRELIVFVPRVASSLHLTYADSRAAHARLCTRTINHCCTCSNNAIFHPHCPQVGLWSYVQRLVPQLHGGVIVVVGGECLGHEWCGELFWKQIREQVNLAATPPEWLPPSIETRTLGEHAEGLELAVALGGTSPTESASRGGI
jgi:hypothetical protein